MNSEDRSEHIKTILKDHADRIKMHGGKNNSYKEDKELKEKLISRLINWKFSQAIKYYDALKNDDSYKCLELLEKIWGDTGWDRSDTIFGAIISYMIELIRLKEGWSYKEFYGEEEEIDVI